MFSLNDNFTSHLKFSFHCDQNINNLVLKNKTVVVFLRHKSYLSAFFLLPDFSDKLGEFSVMGMAIK